ncbi:MAG: RsmD family RNA methyltransferase [Desulfurococcales archaeon]|nr:RsmD family RNA methyltransferase [Desulfurococcales archaeon]
MMREPGTGRAAMIKCKASCYYAILSGEHPTIPRSELEAILEVEADSYSIVRSFEGVVVFEAKLEEPEIVVERAGWVKEIGRFLAITQADTEAIVEVIKDINGVSKILFRRYKRYGENVDEHAIKEMRERKSIRSIQGKRVRVFVTEGITVIGIPIAELDTRSLYYRKPGKRPFFKPGPLSPQLTRAMINLSRLKRGGTFLDPFCGTGGFPLEACFIGASKCLCGDILRDMVEGSRLNLDHYGLADRALVVAHNASAQPFKDHSIDAISTDPPYGRSTTTKRKGYGEIIEFFLKEAERIAKPGTFIVYAGPLQFEPSKIAEDMGLIVVERHHMHVHSTLVREIVVARLPGRGD